jgi:hypothetical protein
VASLQYGRELFVCTALLYIISMPNIASEILAEKVGACILAILLAMNNISTKDHCLLAYVSFQTPITKILMRSYKCLFLV